MRRVLLSALALTSTLAFAQADAGVPAAAPVEPPTAATVTPNDTEALKRDFEAKLEAARREVKELREEMRAQIASSSVAQGWQEDWVDEKRKLELVTIDGYLRVRPELFYKFDMGRGLDEAGYSLFPRSPSSSNDRTNVGVNMRFRFEPTINVSEEVRIRTQIDALDNLVWGSTPDYAYSRNGNSGYYNDRNEFSLFSMSQTAQRSGINSLQDSIAVKRVWGEISTPVGILRFGRMGTHWGTGMLYNDGNGIDNDFGDTVDRVSFTAEPLAGFYITPMIDMNVAGMLSQRTQEGGQPFDLTPSDNATSFILAVQRRDTEQERRQRLAADQTVFNYGLHFTYRTQRFDAVDTLSAPFTSDGVNTSTANQPIVLRRADIFIPDLWARIERKEFRIEAEVAAILGSMQGRQLSTGAEGQLETLNMYQFGAVLQGEAKLLNGDLEIGGEIGFASGDKAPGMGNYPRRRGSNAASDSYTGLGDVDGKQYNCATGCANGDNEINNFRFNRDYRVDMILYREILGGVTDSLYFKPKAKYRITQGFEAFASVIYSRAIFLESTPGAPYDGSNNSLGVEINGGARYETEDGFYGQIQYGILFPLEGFAKTTDPQGAGGIPRSGLGVVGGSRITLENPQALRCVFGIRF
ncbi:MAG: TIGR04551 family protein [Archangium sp.]